MEIYQSWLDRLHSDGCRLTKARKAVVETIASSQRAHTPQQVFEIARSRYPPLGLVTVYRTLEKLEELGLIQRVHQESGCNSYLPNIIGHQHLIICEICGRTEFFQGEDLQPLFNQVNRLHGYLVKSHWLQLSGICKDCQVNRSGFLADTGPK